MTAPPLRPPASPLALSLRFQPGRPAIAAGLRAAVATVVPLLVATALRSPHASWGMLAGFSVSLGDKGGAYATRARALAVITLLDAAAAALGALVSEHVLLSVGVVLCWSLAANLLRVLGAAATSAGTSSTIVLLISLAAPTAGAGEPLARAAFVLAGGAWAMLLALALWPLRPYRPTRLAIAACYEELARYARALTAPGQPRAAADRLATARGGIRARIEHARALVGAARRGRSGDTPRGERLLVLVEVADQLFGLLIGLTDVVEARRRAVGADALATFADIADRIADEVTLETRLGRTVRAPARRAVLPSTARVTASQDGRGRDEDDPTHTGVLLDRLVHYATLAEETASAIAHGAPAPEPVPVAAAASPPPERRAGPRELLRATLSRDSLTLRHAVRVALVTTITLAVVRAVGLQRGYWATLTAVVILQPTAGPTMLKALQRVGGTVLGGVITAALAGVLHDERGIVVLTFVLAAACVAVLPLNYALYSVLLTPTFVLLAEVDAGDWHLAEVRVVNTLVGGALALAGAWLLWPSREGHLFGRTTADALLAARDHLRCVRELWTARGEDAEQRLARGRSRAGMAALNAEASLERLLSEWPARAARLEAAYARIVYLRRLTVATTGLAAVRLLPGAEADEAHVAAFVDAASGGLEAMSALAREAPPTGDGDGEPLSTHLAILPDEAAATPAVRAQLARVAGQLRILAGAFARG